MPAPPALPTPPTPTTTDAGIVKAISNVVRYIERVASGFCPKGAPLDVASCYEELAAASKPHHLAIVCERLSLYCRSEAVLHRAPTSDTLTGFTSGFATMAEKYMEASIAHVAKNVAARQPAHIQIALTYDVAHAQAQRAMLHLHAGRAVASSDLMSATRSQWRSCIGLVAALPADTTVSAAALAHINGTVTKLVEDILSLHYASQLLTRSSDDYFGALSLGLLTEELSQLSAARPADLPLNRLRLARTLQTPHGTTEERSEWRTELRSLPLISSARDSTQPPASCLSAANELLSLVEHAFVGQQLRRTDGPHDENDHHAALTGALAHTKQRALVALAHARHAALKSVSADADSSEAQRIGAHFTAEAHRLHAAHDLACAHLTHHAHLDYRSCHDHCRHALAHLTKAAQSDTDATHAAAPMQRFVGLVQRVRLFYLWSAQAELRGAHAEAKYICNKALEDAQAQFYSQIRSDDATADDTTGDDAYAALLAGHLYLARLHAKLDFFTGVGASLAACGGLSDSASADDDAALERRLHATATFVAANGVHARQVRAWQRRTAASRECGDDVDALAKQLADLRTSADAAAAAACTDCALFALPVAAEPAHAFTPCVIDATLDSVLAASATRRRLTSLLATHAAVRHPPLERAMHQQLAREFASDGAKGDATTRAAYHLHQSLGLSARSERDMMRPAPASHEKTPDGDELAAFTAFLDRLPVDWAICTIDIDAASDSLLVSRSTRVDRAVRVLPALRLSSLRRDLAQSLARADEASKMAGQYNSDRAVRKAESTRAPAQSRTVKARIVALRGEANSGVADVCAGLEEILGDALNLLRGDSHDAPVILLLGSSVAQMPWENMPSLESQHIYRMCNWRFIDDQLRASASSSSAPASPSEPPTTGTGYFVLNPQGTTAAADEFAAPLTALGWSGTTGAEAVNTAEWLDALQRPGYFAYVGHNGGEELLHPRDILKVIKSPEDDGSCGRVRAVAMQVGCSSALQRYKEAGSAPLYEADGLSLVYGQTLCPAMFGCIWNVPEDIDRWLRACVDEVSQTAAAATAPVPSKRTTRRKQPQTATCSRTLVDCAIAARQACNHRHLTAASVVCYGLPVIVQA